MRPEELFPEIEPYNTGFLTVSGGHEIYYEQCGNPKGKPIRFIHGGPGAGCDKKDRRFFDPDKWQITLVDQRGSNRSKPFGELRHNTTWHLVDDLVKLNQKLGIRQTALFGGSWGSTLASVYAISHPETVSGMILRGIFLGEKDEADYYMNGQTALFFPEAWGRFAGQVPKEYRKDPAAYYQLQLKSPDPKVRRKFAYEWAFYELSLLHLEQPVQDQTDKETNDFSFESLALMEAHYLSNNCFLKEGFIIRNAGAIPPVPISIIQGRYDMVCPPISAYRLHKALSTSTLHIVLAGHSSRDPEIRKKLVSETDALFDKIH